MQKLLLIEDNEFTSLLIKRDLLSLGYEDDNIVVCSNWQQVSELPSEGWFIVISDLTLPDSDASQTFDHIAHHFSPDTPIIIISAKTEEEFALQTIQSGAQDYILKTELNKRVLEKAIRYAVERKKSAGDYERLFVQSPVPMYMYDRSTLCFLAANEACLQQYGYSSEAFLHLSALDIRAPEERAAFQQAYTSIGDAYTDFGQWRHKRSNGEIFYVHIYAHSTRFQGKAAMLATAIDIDKKVRNEQELEEKERKISSILESITDGFFALNDNWEFTYVNKECETLLNVVRGQIIGKNIWSVLSVEKYAKFYTEYKLAVKDNVNVHFEEHLANAKKWVSVNAYPTRRGLAVYLVDITERRKIRERLYNDEQQLRAVINNSTDLIWSVDETRNILIANDAFRKRIRQTHGANTKPHLFDEAIVHKDTLPQWDACYKRAFAGETFSVTWQKNEEGNDLYDEVCFTPIFNKTRQVVSVNCFSRDVTQQQHHLKKIEQQNRQLSKIGWLHTEEARSPVVNIITLSHLLNVTDPTDPDNKRLMEGMVTSANELNKVITKIADVIAAGNGEPGDIA